MRRRNNDRRQSTSSLFLPAWAGRYARLDVTGYVIIFVCAAISVALSWIGGPMYIEHFDTDSYFIAIDAIFSGNIDAYRTPVYPLFLGCLKLILGGDIHAVKVTAVILQWVFFLYSSVYLGKLLEGIGTKEHVAFFVVLAYVLCPNINGYNYMVTTESFAVSSMVFMLWWAWKIYDSPAVRNQVILWLIVMVMIYLRPIFLYLLPVLAVYEVAIWRTRRYSPRNLVAAVMSVVVLVVSLGVYVMYMNRDFKVRSISIVGYHNNYHIIRDLHALPVGDYENKVIVSAIDSIYRSDPDRTDLDLIFEEIFELQDQFGYGECNDFVMRTISDHKQQVMCKILGHFYKASQYKMFNDYNRSSIWELFAPGFCLIYIVMVAWSYIIIRLMYVRRGIDPVQLMVWMLFVSGVVAAIIGAPSDYGRLTMPCAAPLMVFIAWVCSNLKWRDTMMSQTSTE